MPTIRWPEAVLRGRATGYAADIRAVYAAGSNLLNQGGDLSASVRAMESVEFSVCHDMFMTPTARWCDVILPVASALEKGDIGIPWAGNYVLYKEQVVPRRGIARDDFEIFAELADRSGSGHVFHEGKNAEEWIGALMAESDIPDREDFMRRGIHLIESERSGCDAFAADPGRHPLDTPSGKVEIESLAYARATGFPASPRWVAPDDVGLPLRLITPKSRLRTHSQLLEDAPEGSAGNGDSRLETHPDDAAARGLADGDEALLRNAQGCVRVRVACTEGILRGTVSLSEGLWYRPSPPDGLSGSPNVLTAMVGTGAYDACVMHGIPVELSRVSPIRPESSARP